MKKDYEEFLKGNKEIIEKQNTKKKNKKIIKPNKQKIEYIKHNDITKLIEEADSKAKEFAEMDGSLHSYRYSQLYDILECNGIERGKKAIEITKLLENPYNKSINELVDDPYDNSMVI